MSNDFMILGSEDETFPKKQIHACYMGQLVSFLDGQLCVLLFHNVLAALSAFWRAGGAHEQLEDPSSLTQELVKPPTRKVEVLYGEGQDVLPYNPLNTYCIISYHVLSCPTETNCANKGLRVSLLAAPHMMLMECSTSPWRQPNHQWTFLFYHRMWFQNEEW